MAESSLKASLRNIVARAVEVISRPLNRVSGRIRTECGRQRDLVPGPACAMMTGMNGSESRG